MVSLVGVLLALQEHDPAATQPWLSREALLAVLVAGVLVIGGGLFVFIHLTGSYTRRRLRSPTSRSKQGPDNWAAKRYLNVSTGTTPPQPPTQERPPDSE